MPRKIFLSFLGAGGYTPCNYVFGNGLKAENVKIFQEAIWQKGLPSDFGAPGDCVIMACTELSIQKNWALLEEQWRSTGIPDVELIQLTINDGANEAQIWDNFSAIFDELQEGDELWLDVTNAFRTIPMLGLTLVFFAKEVLNVQVRAIYYGAFEVLGSPKDVGEMPLEQRNAPVFNLGSFLELIEWTHAANDFMKFGNARSLAALAKKIKQSYPNASAEASIYHQFYATAMNLSSVFDCSRGPDIVNGKVFEDMRAHITKLKEVNRSMPLEKLFDKIIQKTAPFQPDKDILNGLEAVKWCIEHALIPQGFTLLQETAMSWLVQYLNQAHKALLNQSNFGIWVQNNGIACAPAGSFRLTQHLHKGHRMLALEIIKAQNTDKLAQLLSVSREVALKLQVDPNITAMRRAWNIPNPKPNQRPIFLPDLRNDINHGGFTAVNPNTHFCNVRQELLEKSLQTYYDQIKNLITNNIS